MEKKEFDLNQAYKLIAVTDKNGLDKGHSHDFYEDRMNCIATDFRYDDFPSHGDKYRLNMRFVQNEDGLWIKRGLHTSVIWLVEDTEKGMKLHTNNSIYVFEKAELKEVPYQDAANLIELYMSLEDNDYFGKGFYYDEEKKPHELKEHVHVGTFQDCVLVHFAEDNMFWKTVCRYFPMGSYVEFYDTMYHQQDYSTPMLIHNTGRTDLEVRFQLRKERTIIAPGESKLIEPFSRK